MEQTKCKNMRPGNGEKDWIVSFFFTSQISYPSPNFRIPNSFAPLAPPQFNSPRLALLLFDWMCYSNDPLFPSKLLFPSGVIVRSPREKGGRQLPFNINDDTHNVHLFPFSIGEYFLRRGTIDVRYAISVLEMVSKLGSIRDYRLFAYNKTIDIEEFELI